MSSGAVSHGDLLLTACDDKRQSNPQRETGSNIHENKPLGLLVKDEVGEILWMRMFSLYFAPVATKVWWIITLKLCSNNLVLHLHNAEAEISRLSFPPQKS